MSDREDTKKCLWCGKVIRRYVKDKKSIGKYNWGRKKFCSKKCTYNSFRDKKRPGWVCRKISKGLTGQKRPNSKPPHYSGEKSSNWKGGLSTTKNYRHIGSSKIKEWREVIYKIDDYTCWICEERGCTLNAHHLKSWTHFPDLRYVVSNGVSLCVECHKIFHKLNTKYKYV